MPHLAFFIEKNRFANAVVLLQSMNHSMDAMVCIIDQTAFLQRIIVAKKLRKGCIRLMTGAQNKVRGILRLPETRNSEVYKLRAWIVENVF